jgi:uncharacterized protein (TIGR01777 family)
MKILITGATGLVGNELVSLLLQNGFSIHYLTTSKKKIENQPNYQGFFWNPTQGLADEKCLEGVGTIIHLAGASISKRWTSSYKQEIIESRTLSTQTLFKLLKNHTHQVKKIVSASAIGIYPDSLGQLYDENSQEVASDFLGNVVLKWEESVDNLSRLDISVCKIRIGLVLSMKGGALPEMVKPIRFGMGAAFGSGKQWQSWIHIHDLARIFMTAIDKNWEGTYNAVAPHPVDNQALTQAIAKQLKKPLFLPNIPAFVMNFVLGEMHQLLFASQKVCSKKVVAKGFDFKYNKIDDALKNLLG